MSTLLCAVFPKHFERAKFLAEFMRCHVSKVVRVTRVQDGVDEVIVHAKTGHFRFLTLLVNESDVVFGFELSKIIRTLLDSKKFEGEDLRFLLVGTAGILNRDAATGIIPQDETNPFCLPRIVLNHHNAEDQEQPHDDIGDVYFIDRAAKFDRGSMKFVPQDGTTQVELSKLDIAVCNDKGVRNLITSQIIRGVQKDAEGVAPRVAGSSNMLILSKRLPVLENIADLNGKRIDVVDMESYDFFKLCSSLNVRCCGALRVVSDVCGDRYSDVTRCFMRFDKIVNVFVQILVRMSLRLQDVESLSKLDKLQCDELKLDLVDVQWAKIEKKLAKMKQASVNGWLLQAFKDAQDWLERRDFLGETDEICFQLDGAVWTDTRKIRIVQQLMLFQWRNDSRDRRESREFNYQYDDAGDNQLVVWPFKAPRKRLLGANKNHEQKHDDDDDDDDGDDDDDATSEVSKSVKKRNKGDQQNGSSKRQRNNNSNAKNGEQ